MANPMEEISPVDRKTICSIIRYGFDLHNPLFDVLYQSLISTYTWEAVDAKINECKASLSKKRRDISWRKFLPNYRIQQFLKDKMDHLRGKSN